MILNNTTVQPLNPEHRYYLMDIFSYFYQDKVIFYDDIVRFYIIIYKVTNINQL